MSQVAAFVSGEAFGAPADAATSRDKPIYDAISSDDRMLASGAQTFFAGRTTAEDAPSFEYPQVSMQIFLIVGTMTAA